MKKVWWKISMLKIGEKEKWRNKGINNQQQPVCTNFQSSRPHSSREKWRKISMLKTGEKEKWRNKGTNKQQQPDSGTHDTSAHCPHVYQVQSSRPHNSWEKCDKNSLCVPIFSLLGLIVPKKSDEKFQCWKLERKKKEEIKEQISSSSLIPVHMIHLPTVHMCTKFNLLGLTIPEKSVTKTF